MEQAYRGGLGGKLMQTVKNNDETVLPHKGALFQATFPLSHILEKNIFSLVDSFWPKQIGLLVLARWGKFIHEKEE